MSLTENLLALHKIDSQLRGLRRRLESAQIYLDAQNRQHGELVGQRTELQTHRKQTQATIANLESEGESIDERIEKLREELNAAQTNKQYTALLTEVNTIKLNRKQVDDSVLEEMERIEEIDQQLETVNQSISEREKVQNHARQQLQQRKDEIGERLAELEAERAEAATPIPDEQLKIFDELAEEYDGEAMSHIEEVSPRHNEYACGECNMHITFEAVSSAQTNNDKIVQCGECGRILYMQNETAGAKK